VIAKIKPNNVIEFKRPNLPKFYYDDWERVPKGQYEATFMTWSTFQFRTATKIALIFSIIEYGQYFEKVVPMFCNVKKHKGKIGERGQFIAPARGDLIKKVFYGLNPEHPKIRPDRVPLTKLEGRLYKITTDDVINDSDQNKLPEQMIYSKVVKVENI